ncbi:MAG: hypothetical protein AABY87_02590 [bacterium]
MKQVIIENPVIYLTEVANKYGDAWIENKLREAKARILITNFHAFKLRERNGAGKLTKAILSQGGESPFTELWEEGTDYVDQEQFQKALTSKQLKIKLKTNNISGLQLADLLAHLSRNEILQEQGLLGKDLGFFAQKVVEVLQKKYYQHDGKMFGKKFL